MSPQELKAAFAAFARDAIAEVDTQNAAVAGHVVPHDTFVDGSKSDNLASVNIDGTIAAEWELTNDVVQFVVDELLRSAPFLTGKFRSSIKIYADGVEVDSPLAANGAQVVVIAPSVPYARKIENQFHKPAKAWADNTSGLFHVVAALAAGRYGNIARIRFGARSLVGGATDLGVWAARHSAKSQGRTQQRRQYEKDTRQPAVVIDFGAR